MVGSRGVVAWCWKPKYLGRFLTVRNVAELLGILDSEEKGLFLDPRIVSRSEPKIRYNCGFLLVEGSGEDSIGWIGLSIERMRRDSRFSGNEELEYEIKRNGGLLKGNIRDIRVGRGYNILHLRGCISGNYDTSNRQRR